MQNLEFTTNNGRQAVAEGLYYCRNEYGETYSIVARDTFTGNKFYCPTWVIDEPMALEIIEEDYID